MSEMWKQVQRHIPPEIQSSFPILQNCKSEFSALKGTVFWNTHLDLRMWLYAMNLVIVSRKGISALQLKRELDVGSY